MATVKVVDLIFRARTILQDTTSVRWALSELQLWLNDSYRETLNFRPDSNTLTGTFECVPGPRQTLTAIFPNATRLVSVVRNVAAHSNKYAVHLIDRRVLDTQRRGWFAEPASISAEQYVFDARQPKEFMVYPPSTVLTQLEVLYAQVPTAHTLTDEQLGNLATAEVIRIDDTFANALLDYILFRAYTKDAEQASNAARAVAHYQAFQNSLGVSAQVNAASQPGVA